MNKSGAARLLCVLALSASVLPAAVAAAQASAADGIAALQSVFDGAQPSRAQLCRYGTGADAVESRVVLDIRTFGVGQVCGPELEDDVVVVGVETATAWDVAALDYFEVFYDVDGNDRNGCGGAELVAAAVPDGADGLAATLYEARGCDSSLWTFRGEAVAGRGGTTDGVGIAIERVLFAGTSGTFRFYTVLKGEGAGRADIAPTGRWASFTMAPENPGGGGDTPDTPPVLEEDEPPRTCFDDRFGDARDGALLVPRGDIVEYCALLTDSRLELWARMAEPTNPGSAASWDQVPRGEDDEDTLPTQLSWTLDVGVPVDESTAGERVLDGRADFRIDLEVDYELVSSDEGGEAEREVIEVYGESEPVDTGGCPGERHLADFERDEIHVSLPIRCIDDATQLSLRVDLLWRDVEELDDEEPVVPPGTVVRDGAPRDPAGTDTSGYGDDVFAGPVNARRDPHPPPTGVPAPGSGLFDGDPATTDRVDVRDATSFALHVSRARFVGWQDEPAGSRASYAVLARDDVFADALAAAPLLAAGPLLLAQRSQISDQTLAELHRILPMWGTVYVLGGPAAIGPGVVERLAQEGFDPVRVEGADRIETSVRVAQLVVDRGTSDGGTAVLARAFGGEADPTAAWADAVSAGAWAARDGVPVLLTPTASLDPRVAEAFAQLGTDQTVLVGGHEALSATVEAAAPGARRVAGSTRAGTAVAVATELWGADAPPRAIVANAYTPTGWAFALAVAGGVGPASGGAAPVLYADRDTAPPETVTYLSTRCTAMDLLIAGDTGLISPAVARVLEQANDDGDPSCAA